MGSAAPQHLDPQHRDASETSFLTRPHENPEVEMEGGRGDTEVVGRNHRPVPPHVGAEVSPPLRLQLFRGRIFLEPSVTATYGIIGNRVPRRRRDM